MLDKEVIVIGAGLAGSEAAWQVANFGVPVKLVEMRPIKSTPAHHSGEFGELVCSNSFGALSPDRAAGLLQKELRIFKSLIVQTADNFAVPAGGALAVDRSKFSIALTDTPEFATCQAASEPARPAPITITSFSIKLD